METDFPSDLFFSTREICIAAGVTYRKIDYWCRVGLLTPVMEANGSGTQRKFEYEQVAVVRIVGTLLHLGVDHDQIRAAVERVGAHGPVGTVEPFPGVVVDLAVVAANRPPAPTETRRAPARRPRAPHWSRTG